MLEDLAEGDPNGTMGVIDLWSDKNINKVRNFPYSIKVCYGFGCSNIVVCLSSSSNPLLKVLT